MYSKYFATFPAGAYDVIVKNLKGFRLSELKIIEHDDSSVVFESTLPIERLIEIRYYTNVYLVVDNMQTFPKTVLKGKYFRLMMIKNGAPQQIETSERAKVETQIIEKFQLKPNTHLSRNDFYIIERTSGAKLLTLRLARAKFKREELQAGELRPELAHILCLVAGVKSNHVVVDMFAGYGSIPFEAVRGFGCEQVITIDNQKVVKRHEHPLIKWHESDTRNLDFIEENSVDRIITDPPWGVYDTEIGDLNSLYDDFIKEMLRILKPDGVAVVLSGFDKVEQCFKRAKKLKQIGKWNVLVSGKKATIYKLQKAR